MELLIFRHGIAEDSGPDGDDASRRLTDDGAQKTRQAAHGLTRFATRPHVLLTSPLVRARQTAAIVGDVFGLTAIVMKSLAYGPADAVIADLRHRREPCVMIVGHEPTLSRVAGMLCTGDEGIDFLQLKKAGCISLDAPISDQRAPGGAKLLWLATPKMLRTIG